MGPKWGSPELKEWIGKQDGRISDDLRLAMLGIQHISARLGHLHAIGYYASLMLTAILIALLIR
jgi:hypothetical protein